MLQIKNISKKYEVGGIVTKALDDVSLNLRDNEFVAILGPSGSGKTTLLNIIGGLDRYDSGDLIINGIATKRYTDRDWDSYRNHTIGFVFQSYNLIPHQTVLQNVELALTISGISRAERKRRAKEALEKVGLTKHINKKPNQMSGGQMQRVAIARALVNNPDILLADEPTGALDTETSVQVMELLKEVAKDRLVVMVTHNPELAEEYATRIVRVKDGVIHDDSNPYDVDAEQLSPPQHKNMGKSSMSLKTALALSFNNLLTKKARTLLTSFAGSIGIIGIALILALSNGVNLYISSLEEDTLSEYPIQITKSTTDITSMIATNTQIITDTLNNEADVTELKTLNTLFAESKTNDLQSLKQHLESGNSDIDKYSKAVEYNYNVQPKIFRMTDEDSYRQINPDKTFSSMSGSIDDMTAMILSMSTSYFSSLPSNEELYINQYDIKAGNWPQNYNECVVVLTSDGSIQDLALYAIGLKDTDELDEILKSYSENGKAEISTDISTFKYEDFLDVEFKLVNPTDLYEYDKENNVYVNKSDDEKFMLNKVKNGESLKIVGVVQPKEDSNAAMLTSGVNYSSSLIDHIVEQAQDSSIVKKQLKNPDVNVFTGKEFGDENNSLNLESFLKIDENALDLSALSSNLDMSSMMGTMDMSSIMGNLDLSSAMSNMDLSEAFKDVDMSAIMQNVDLAEILKNIDVSDIMEGVDVQAALESVDLSDVIEQLDFSNIDVTVSQADLEKLFDILLANYTAQVPQGELPSFDGFFSYIHSDDGQQIIQDNVDSIIDADALKQKLEAIVNGEVYNAVTKALGEAMTPVIEQISNNFVKAISEQLAPVFAETTQQFVGVIANTLGEQLSSSLQQSIGSAMGQFGSQFANSISSQLNLAMGDVQTSLADAFSESFDEDSIQELMNSMMNPTAGSYEDVLASLNYAEFDDPYSISIYPKDFDSKEQIVQIIEDYNNSMEKNGDSDKIISYTDTVGTLMSSVTTIVDIVSYVLIAFVAVSLIVSSIMIGIITYISVLERTKEIGILRAVGASKRNISQVFNAETLIIGLCSGIIGIGATLLIMIPGNAVIHHFVGTTDINAVLSVPNATILIVLSVILTLIGGLIPSKKAAKKDPVTALRSE